jgi:hypothetical protein
MAVQVIGFKGIQCISRPFVGGLDQFVGPWSEFMHAAAAFTVIWLLLWYMYRKKTFIKI